MKRAEGLITNLGLKSPVSEAFRTLRTNLEFINPGQPLNTIMFTSSGPGEGKSTTIINTAITMAHSGKRVLLIDCDLRKPVVHKVLELSNMQGLTNLLVDMTLDAESIIQRTEINNLDALPSGPIPPNPAELLGSQRMFAFLNELTQIYDLILLDAPPIIAVTDAAILATQIDGVILIVGAGQADRGMVLKAKSLLDKVKAKILGVVMTKVKIQKSHEYYYYYETKDDSYAG